MSSLTLLQIASLFSCEVCFLRRRKKNCAIRGIHMADVQKKRCVVRRATMADAEALVKVTTETFVETFGHMYPPEDLAQYLKESYSIDKMVSLLENNQYALWVLEEEDTGKRGGAVGESACGIVVGHALAGPCGLPHADIEHGDGEVKRLYVLKSHQKEGHGQRLMDAAMEWLLSSGPRTLWLGVWSENYGAQKFYQRYGFEKAGEYEFPVGKIRDHEFIFRRAANANPPLEQQ